MMHMTFYWGTKVTVLFDFWKTETWVDYSLTLLTCLLFSSFYQYLEHRRIQLVSASKSAKTPLSDQIDSSAATTTTPLLRGYTSKLQGCGSSVLALRLAGAGLFGVNSALGYMLMLAVMSFNGGVLLAVVFGLSIGYLFFRSSPDVVVVTEDSPNCACA